MEGYDFFEFYKAILSAGADNPAVYPMAFTMAQSMDKKITRDLLITQSDFYVQEISKVHTKYVGGGNDKKNELLGRKENEREQLGTEVQNLRMQIEALTNQLNNAQNNLVQIDNKYANDLTEVECKLMANDVAKNNLLASIDKVKQGLINNVK
jgi:CII-binding regulator of phage lambda lysogenization HflD